MIVSLIDLTETITRSPYPPVYDSPFAILYHVRVGPGEGAVAKGCHEIAGCIRNVAERNRKRNRH